MCNSFNTLQTNLNLLVTPIVASEQGSKTSTPEFYGKFSFFFFADVKHVTELCETSKKEDHWYLITGQITCNSNVIFCVYIRDAVSFMDHVHLLISLHVGEVLIDCMHH